MNFSKITLAALMALLFASCSDENQSIGSLGGTEEETAYVLTGRVGDVYPKLMKMSESEDDSLVDTTKLNTGSVFAAKGTIVTVYELDSMTLENTGRSFVDTIDNDSGRFAFENISLHSRFVLIENKEPYETYNSVDSLMTRIEYNVFKAIVDLSRAEKVSVNSLTNAKVPVLRKYFAEGNSFADANKMAEHEILENLGIYEDLGNFENIIEENSELSYVNDLIRWDEDNLRSYLDLDVALSFATPSKAFSSRGKIFEEYYLATKKMIDYKIGRLAKMDGLGRCTDGREQEVGSLGALQGRGGYAVVCRSGKWTLGFKTIEHTKGTMTDKRDGKTYKTVTYNWGDVSQTWMAEKLNFADTTSLGIDSSLRANLFGSTWCNNRSGFDDVDCSIYGRSYEWRAAMNIGKDDIRMYSVNASGDTTYPREDCFDALWMEERDLYEMACDTLLGTRDSVGDYVEKKWTWNYTDFIPQSKLNSYQGVCPDGWRISTWSDWEILLKELGERYGVDYYNVVPALYDEVATGFGMNAGVRVWFNEIMGWVSTSLKPQFANGFVVADVPMYFVGFFLRGDLWRRGFGFDLSGETYHAFVYMITHDLPGSPYDPYDTYAVRCIKK